MKTYLVNAISPTMFRLPCLLGVREAGVDDARRLLSRGYECAIGHPGTAQLASKLLGVEASRCRRIQLAGLKPGAPLVVLTLRFRPPEGKVYSYEELQDLLEKGQIGLYIVEVEG